MKFPFCLMAPILFFMFICGQCQASENFSHKLAEIINKIKNIRHEIVQNRNEQSDVQKQLQHTENDIYSVSSQLSKTNDELQQLNKILSKLTFDQDKIQTNITKQQLLLLQEIKAQYLLGLNKNKSQLILNAKDFNKIERLLTYNSYLKHQTTRLTRNLKHDLQQLELNKNKILQLCDRTKVLHEKQIQQQKELCSHKEKQQIILATLSSQVKTKSQQLADLLKNKENLENTIKNLAKNKTVYKSDFLMHHKGKFPWPTEGRILENFGSNIGQSELKQNGVLISASAGQKVYSVAPGKVIFANRMPGYGLLLIIDHGKGYMTVYGNNDTLYKKSNDLVGPHDLIAKVGHTQGERKPTLYFALRFQGKPINPCTWCG